MIEEWESCGNIENIDKDKLKLFGINADDDLDELNDKLQYFLAIYKNEQYISSEVLSDKIEFVNSLPNFDEIEIDEEKFKVKIEKI